MNLMGTLSSKPRLLPIFVALSSAMILAAAYVSQYGFGLDPCQLCYYQRVPYAVNIILGLLAALCCVRRPKLARVLIWVCALSFFLNAILAMFHVGVEHKWWEGLSSCANYALPQNATVEEMRAFLLSRATPVRCDVPAFVLFGISMAGYNALMSAFLSALTVWAARRSSCAAR